jgi:16S rRNA (cytidine1402-2'-O)-methyltransferase
MSGTLYLVATPIGNLEDITVRALRILGEVQLIAAEDTRRTAKLLRHYGIATSTTSLHDHNERERTPALVERLGSGDSIALLSDAGTPIISDPGLLLVREALSAGISVVSLPGPSAPIAALVSSGAPSSSFTFVGFPPRRSNDRKKWLEALADEQRTLIFFEAPHRLIATLTQIETVWGNRSVALCRELTKIHEELVIGPISELLPTLGPPRGEYTCVVWPAPAVLRPAVPVPEDAELLVELSQTADNTRSRRDAVREMARKYGMTVREMYAAVESAK